METVNHTMNKMDLIRNDQKLKGFAILVVEDSELNQQVAKEILECSGATVVVAEHGKEALGFLSKESFDCVLMDIQMPIMGGLETTQMIRTNVHWSDLPIIALTADADQRHRDLCQYAGMSDFLAKPINPDLLINTLLKWL